MTLLQLLADNSLVFAVAAGILGLLIGSFLNVVIFRLPVMLESGWRAECEDFLADENENSESQKEEPRFDLAKPGSHCPKCKHKIAWWENIPIISFMLLRGKCRGCKVKISFRYPIVELLTGVLSFFVAFHFEFGAQAGFALLLTWALIALSLIDYDTQLLPDVITLPLLWLGLIISLWAVFIDPSTSIIGAASGYMVLWIVFQLFKLVTGKEGMGFGDFKLLAVLGAWLGWQLLPAIILLSSLAGAVIGISLMLFKQHNKNKPIPFGPYLAIAGWLALMWGQQINQMYFELVL